MTVQSWVLSQCTTYHSTLHDWIYIRIIVLSFGLILKFICILMLVRIFMVINILVFTYGWVFMYVLVGLYSLVWILMFWFSCLDSYVWIFKFGCTLMFVQFTRTRCLGQCYPPYCVCRASIGEVPPTGKLTTFVSWGLPCWYCGCSDRMSWRTVSVGRYRAGPAYSQYDFVVFLLQVVSVVCYLWDCMPFYLIMLHYDPMRSTFNFVLNL